MSKVKIKKMIGKVVSVAYHRNEVCGEGFWVVIFDGHKDSDVAGERFVATHFPDRDEVRTAVLRVSDIAGGDAEMPWRGDRFHHEIQTIVQATR